MDKKGIVIKTARELFRKYGYKKVTMDEVAKCSGVTKKTIYTYFANKESMFEYFVIEEAERMREVIKTLKNEMDFASFVSLSVYKMLLFRKNSDIVNAILRDTSSFGEVSNFLNIFDSHIISFIEDEIVAAIDNDDIRACNPHLTAFIIYKVYISLLFEYGDILDEERVAFEVTSILKDGLLS